MSEIGISLPAAIGILFFLLLASAFFSGSETALTRARRVRLRVLADQEHAGAIRAEQLLGKPERMLTAILLGNNFVNIAASALATALFVDEFGEAGIVYATIAMTIVVLIFSEILPKTIAVAHAEPIACHVARPLLWIQRVLAPLIATLMAIIEGMQRLFRVPKNIESGFTHRELATMIDMSASTGTLDSAREQMLMSSLRLHEIAIKSLMTPRKDITMLDAHKSVSRCKHDALRNPHSRYPVFLEHPDNLLGIVHLRDLLKLADSTLPLANAMIWRDPPYAPANRNALTQLFEFQSKRQHMAIVVDELGDIEGLITLEDIIEEIVGDIVDESDIPGLPEVWPQPDGSLVVAGTANLHDINLAYDSNLPEDSATTIGGLIVDTLGHQPEGKITLPVSGVQLEVLTLQGDWIQRVRISRIESDQEADGDQPSDIER